ncbi:hypothetical protein NicSoilB8_46010 (plasmid) [Arthrobacter sp. NicSoilB8]|nr:hypothetical protein NicSoilB8_46010 [Arthrobacter sp. NicSoilB8]
MVALDVDGTLVNHDGHMSIPVREAAQTVVAAGHEVLIATGRSLNATLPIIEQIGINTGYAVCCNGGVTLRLDPAHPDGYEVIHKATFDPGRALRKRLPWAKYALEDEDGKFLSTERFQDASFGVEAIGVDFPTMLEATAVRVVVFSSEDTPEDFNEAIEDIGLLGVAYSVGWSAWLDIAAEGVTKASALEHLRGHLSIEAHRTVAIGEGIQTVEDARKVVDHGADGIVLSNHGGRQLDRAPIPFRLLPEVSAALKADRSEAAIILDTGIMSGADIIAVLALGADFTLIGRAYLYGLMAGGRAGVDRAIQILERTSNAPLPCSASAASPN